MSIRIDPGQKFVVYPPALGPGGVCTDVPGGCPHLFCNQARHDAATLCPECNQPLGFGAIVPLRRIRLQGGRQFNPKSMRYEWVEEVWSEPLEPVLIHYDCYQTKLAREEAAKMEPGVSVTFRRDSVTISVDDDEEDGEDNPDA